MTLEQQVHQNDVKLHKLMREFETLKKQVAEMQATKIDGNTVLAVSCRICDAKFTDEYGLEAHMNFYHK